MTDNRAGRPFDEQAALAELEQLRDAIQAARRARQEKLDEFERFVQGFRKPAARRPDRSDARPEASDLIVPALPPAAPAAPYEPVPVQPDAAPTGATAARPRRRIGNRTVILLGVAGVTAAALLLYQWRQPSDRPSAPNPVTSAPNTAAPAARPPAVPTAAAPVTTAPAAALHVELGTLQPVWLRVVVDGQKKLERMIPAGEALRFDADRQIVVRAGNGADVFVKTSSGEERLGVAGQPVTRTFAKPGAAPPRD